MTTDYSKSSNKPEPEEGSDEKAEQPAKHIEKVVKGEVVIRKKGIGRKFKDLVVSRDLKGLAIYLFLERVVPNARAMLYDAWVEGGNRVIFPDAPRRPLVDPRGALGRSIVNYNGISSSPLSRSRTMPLRDPRVAPAREIGPRASSRIMPVQSTRAGEQYVFSLKEDAVRVLDDLREALSKYEVPISVADVYESMGLPSTNGHVDQKWGWTDLSTVKVLQTSDGFVLDFPPSEPIQ